MVKMTGPCVFNSPEDTRYCGVVKNLENCPYSCRDECIADEKNCEKWSGEVLPSGRIILRLLRFRLTSLDMDDNLCQYCHVLWIGIPNGCPICDKE
jgi:hypothetical protein